MPFSCHLGPQPILRSDRATDSLPAIHALHLAELVGRWGVSFATLLRGTRLTKTTLAQPESRIAVATMARLVERARALTGEAALGIYFGLQMRISWHGYVGLAAMAAQNAREALELAVRFCPTRTGAISLHLDADSPVGSLRIAEHADFGAARDAILLALVVGIWQLGCTLTGRQLSGSADLAMGEPPYIGRFAGMLPGALRFGRAENRLLFDAGTLELPLITADPAALLLMREQCERELDALGFAGPLRERVRGLAIRGSGGVRSLEEVAAHLYLSTRTLKRHLAALGVSYTEILDKERARRARTLLAATSLPLEEIAERLGYSDVANFSRAYRRWTGQSPGAVRRAGARRRSPAAQRGPK